jgi:ABC-type transport system involved in multi-copper enzyme maturation permease subunit
VTHNLYISPTRTLAVATYGEIVRRPLYSILLVSFSLAIFLSKFLTLFSFYQEMNMVREMGIATLIFWGFLITVVLSGVVVTQELEDRTAVTLLSKPVRRRDFLLGKFLGLVGALVPGLALLACVLLLTLLTMAWSHLPFRDADLVQEVAAGASPFGSTWSVVWGAFLAREGASVFGGALLALLNGAVVAALAVSLSAFFPVVVSVAATALLFILGNLSGYMLASIERLGSAPLSAAGRALSYVLPNLGYFNLQSHFSEGTILSIKYLGLVSLYASLYVAAVFLVSCSLFEKREVR